jgi:hypothetical protein
MAGRPPKYKPKYQEQAYRLCSIFGADDQKLAEFFKVEEKTINNWKEKYPPFLGAVKKGKDEFDTKNVEASLLKRALGYSYEELHYERIELDDSPKNSDEKQFGTLVKTVIKQVAPDVTAQIFWLKNRDKDRWRDKRDHEITGKEGGPLVLSNLDRANRLAHLIEIAAKRKKEQDAKRGEGNKAETPENGMGTRLNFGHNQGTEAK